MSLELYLWNPFDQAGALRESRLDRGGGGLGRLRTSSEYSKKSPLDSHNEHAVKAWTT